MNGSNKVSEYIAPAAEEFRSRHSLLLPSYDMTFIGSPMIFLLMRGRWVLLLAGCMLCGCVGGPLPEKAAWPWESTKDYDKIQTGNYIGIRGNVAHFDEPPKAVQPVKPASLTPRIPAANSASATSVTQPQPPGLPAERETASGKSITTATYGYDFSLRNIKTALPSYLPTESGRNDYDIIAFNHGSAPVSVTIGIDPASAQNMATDKTLPFNCVVKPYSDQALVRIGPKIKGESFNFRTTYSWNIGDFTARHNCPEHYQFPFGKNVTAIASVSNAANTSAFTRHAVIFAMPVGTPVLAARKGTVVQIRPDKIDILHDDATIATYGHLEKIAADIVVGKSVSTEDAIGGVSTTADQKEGYLQLTVWRPEPVPTASLKAVSQSEGFDFVSFPLEFCNADASQCRVLVQDQMVSRNNIAGAKKQGVRKAKRKGKKDPNG
jgi:hypothetical protein